MSHSKAKTEVINMLSFHNDPKVKKFYLDRVIAHTKADRLIQGKGWDGYKGCAVGCTLEAYDHSRYPIELGLPMWLASLEDYIFERLSDKDAMKWPKQFLSAIQPGISEKQFKELGHRLAVLRQKRNLKIQKENKKLQPQLKGVFDAVIGAIKSVIQYHINPVDSARSAAKSAAESAGAAAWSAKSAAESAADSAAAWSAWSAAWSAWSAADSLESAWSEADSAAESAARSADSAANSAAKSATYKQEAKDLLKLLKELKPKRLKKSKK